VRIHLVDGLLADLLQDARFLRVYKSFPVLRVRVYHPYRRKPEPGYLNLSPLLLKRRSSHGLRCVIFARVHVR
jgi:hypothetical protein